MMVFRGLLAGYLCYLAVNDGMLDCGNLRACHTTKVSLVFDHEVRQVLWFDVGAGQRA